MWPGNHLISRQRGTATDQMDKRGTLDQEDTDTHESDAGSYQHSHAWDRVISRSRAPSSCKQSRRDQNVLYGHRNVVVRYNIFRLCRVSSFYITFAKAIIKHQVVHSAVTMTDWLSRMWSIECRHFQWPQTTPNPKFKVAQLLDAEYLRNGERYRRTVVSRGRFFIKLNKIK